MRQNISCMNVKELRTCTVSTCMPLTQRTAQTTIQRTVESNFDGFTRFMTEMQREKTKHVIPGLWTLHFFCN